MNEHPSEHDPRPSAGNPYQARAGTAAADLDADTPVLQAAEMQRLNRRALVFLAGIILLLAPLAFWLFSGGAAAPVAPPARQAAEQVVIPAAPRDLPDLPEVRSPVEVPELPPLPVIDDSRAPSASPGLMAALPGDVLSGDGGLTLIERRMQDAVGASSAAGIRSADVPAMPGMPGMQDAGPASVMQAPADGPTSARPLYSPDTLLLRGTYIRCILQSRVISDFPGYTSCVVTEPVYSVNGRRLLLPRGSKVMGFYNADSVIGDRAAIVWDRITTPTGLDVNMRSPGVDNLGAAGSPGHYTAHWGQRITSALLISMLSDAFKYAGAEYGPSETSYGNGFVVQSPYESNTARTLERMATLALERNMSRPPTVTINQGALVNVYVARDVDFSAVVQ